jgi:hypothetical protein
MFPPRCLLRSVATELLPDIPPDGKKEGLFDNLEHYS